MATTTPSTATDTTTPAAAASTRSERRAPDPVPSVRQRPRRSLIAIGAVLVATFGLAGFWLATKGATPKTVVIATSDLAGGAPVRADQLGTTQVTGATGANTIDAVTLKSLVGQRPTGDIAAGSILTPRSLAAKITPDEGSAIVPIGVTSSQIPSLGLSAGDAVEVVVAFAQGGENAQNGQDSDSAIAPGTQWKATVVAVGDPGDDGARTVDVAVPAKTAPAVAAAAGTGRLALVVTQTANGR